MLDYIEVWFQQLYLWCRLLACFEDTHNVIWRWTVQCLDCKNVYSFSQNVRFWRDYYMISYFCQIFFFARVLHSVVYISGIPQPSRLLCYTVGVGCFISIISRILSMYCWWSWMEICAVMLWWEVFDLFNWTCLLFTRLFDRCCYNINAYTVVLNWLELEFIKNW